MKALRLFVTALVAFALGSCGGGGEMVARIGGGGSGAPPTTDVGVGGVEGFGSIIINGKHYDETAGQFQVDERPDQPSVISVDAVRLGMQMQFESQSNRISKATVAAEVIGPVSSVTATGLVVLGQPVRINADAANSDHVRRIHRAVRPRDGCGGRGPWPAQRCWRGARDPH